MRKFFFATFLIISSLLVFSSSVIGQNTEPSYRSSESTSPKGLIVVYDSPSDTPERVKSAQAQKPQQAKQYDDLAKRFNVTDIKALFPDKPATRSQSDHNRLETIYTVEVQDPRVLNEAIVAYENLPGVKAVVYDEPIFPLFTPNDTYFSSQWSLNAFEDKDIDAPEAWDMTQGVSHLTAAVLDTGVERTHADLSANMWTNSAETPVNGVDDDGNGYIDDYYGWNFADKNNTVTDYAEHGTHVSGIISAKINNATGIAGVSGNSRIMNLRILTDSIVDERTSDVLKALQYVADKAQSEQIKVVNMSFGAKRQRLDENASDVCAAYEPVLSNLYSKGVSAVAAAGNGEGTFVSFGVPFYTLAPAGCFGVISVGATIHDDSLAGFSNYGSTMTLSAPGTNIQSTCLNSSYCIKHGTSMATPHVAGTIMLMHAKNASLSPWQVRKILNTPENNDPVSGDPNRERGGAGRLNAQEAIQASINPPTANDPGAMTVTDNDLSMTFTPVNGAQYTQANYTITVRSQGTGTPVPYAGVVSSMKKPNGQTVHFVGYADNQGKITSGALISQYEGYVGTYIVTIHSIADQGYRYQPSVVMKTCTFTSTSSTPSCTSTGGSVTPTPTVTGPTPTRTPTPTVAGPTATPTPTTGVIPGTTKVALWRQGTWFLRNTLTNGGADMVFGYGLATDVPLMCDWDGNGSRTIGIFRNGGWYLRNTNSAGNADIVFSFGQTGDVPLCGDWNNDGIETIGLQRGGSWYLRNSNSNGNPDTVFSYGLAGDKPVIGDWNGNGDDTIGIVRGANWFLRNSNSSGIADIVVGYGLSTDSPVVGDWNNTGDHTIGIYRNGVWYLRNSNTGGNAEVVFSFGQAGDKPLVWR